MPRRYYRRTRTVRPKKKWATNINRLIGQQTAVVRVLPKDQAEYTHYLYSSALVTNSATTSIPTPTILKCGNFKLKGDLRLAYSLGSGGSTVSVAGCVAYIVYVPEGYDVNAQIVYQHPEWIMAWTPVDMNLVPNNVSSSQDVQKFSISSRLKRNLNSGDRVMLMMDILFTPSSTATVPVDADIVFTPAIGVQYWTCAN